jgi:hypothetical protein
MHVSGAVQKVNPMDGAPHSDWREQQRGGSEKLSGRGVQLPGWDENQ